MIKIGINGFGRIGRLVFRASLDHKNVEVVGINDLITPDYMAYMLKYDTMHGRFDGTVEYTDHSLIVNGHEIRVTAEKNPADLKWSDVGAEYVVERTDLSLCPIADKMLRAYKGMYCMESFNPLGVQWYRKNHPELVRGQLSDAFLKEGEYVGVLYFVLQNLLLNFVTKPDFVAYNHHYPEILSRKLCRGLYHNTAAAWTIKSQQELDEARKHFDVFIFDSFVPEARK